MITYLISSSLSKKMFPVVSAMFSAQQNSFLPYESCVFFYNDFLFTHDNRNMKLKKENTQIGFVWVLVWREKCIYFTRDLTDNLCNLIRKCV